MKGSGPAAGLKLSRRTKNLPRELADGMCALLECVIGVRCVWTSTPAAALAPARTWRAGRGLAPSLYFFLAHCDPGPSSSSLYLHNAPRALATRFQPLLDRLRGTTTAEHLYTPSHTHSDSTGPLTDHSFAFCCRFGWFAPRRRPSVPFCRFAFLRAPSAAPTAPPRTPSALSTLSDDAYIRIPMQ